MATVGVLGLQGGYAAHARTLGLLGHQAQIVKYAHELDGLDGLIFPGGESTTQLKIIAREGLEGPLNNFVCSGRPVLATCAGMILAARQVTAPEQRSFGWLDISVSRNGWGRQLDSFAATTDGGDLPLLFIRAPRVLETGPEVDVLERFEAEPVLVRQGNVTAATFHPELTEDTRVHHGVFGRA